MENQARKLEGPSMEALQMADAIRRIITNDDGELAVRLDGIIEYPLMTGQAAMFFALTGKEPGEMFSLLGIDPEKFRKATCPDCHHANGLHEPDCEPPRQPPGPHEPPDDGGPERYG